MVGWIKMPLGTEVGPGLGDFVLDGDTARPPQKGAQPAIFGPFCTAQSAGTLIAQGSYV